MKISSKELEAKKVKVVVDKNPVATSFEKWAQPGHFSRTLAKGPKTTTWIWNLHADAHDFDSQTNSLEDISRKIFSAHFGQLSLIFLWISGMWFHGARFSNYSAWLASPTTIKPSSQVDVKYLFIRDVYLDFGLVRALFTQKNIFGFLLIFLRCINNCHFFGI